MSARAWTFWGVTLVVAFAESLLLGYGTPATPGGLLLAFVMAPLLAGFALLCGHLVASGLHGPDDGGDR